MEASNPPEARDLDHEVLSAGMKEGAGEAFAEDRESNATTTDDTSESNETISVLESEFESTNAETLSRSAPMKIPNKLR